MLKLPSLTMQLLQSISCKEIGGRAHDNICIDPGDGVAQERGTDNLRFVRIRNRFISQKTANEGLY